MRGRARGVKSGFIGVIGGAIRVFLEAVMQFGRRDEEKISDEELNRRSPRSRRKKIRPRPLFVIFVIFVSFCRSTPPHRNNLLKLPIQGPAGFNRRFRGQTRI
jgi:hypothetical protein